MKLLALIAMSRIDTTKEYEFMLIIETLGSVLFVVLMIIGYRKNNRNIMLIASLCLFVAVAGPDFAAGVIEGFNEAPTSNPA